MLDPLASLKSKLEEHTAAILAETPRPPNDALAKQPEPNCDKGSLSDVLGAIAVSSESASVHLLVPKIQSDDSRSDRGLDLDWHLQRLVEAHLRQQHDRYSGSCGAAKKIGADEVAWWLILPIAELSEAGLTLDGIVNLALTQSHKASEAAASRILRSLQFRKFDKACLFLVCKDANLVATLCNSAYRWCQERPQLKVVVAIDTEGTVGPILPTLDRSVKVCELDPPHEDSLTAHFMTVVDWHKHNWESWYQVNVHNPAARWLGEAVKCPELNRRMCDIALASSSALPAEVLAKIEKCAVDWSGWVKERFHHIFEGAKVASYEQLQDDFMTEIKKSACDGGASFVVVLGRGLNPQCGIPDNQQIADYLVHVANSHFNQGPSKASANTHHDSSAKAWKSVNWLPHPEGKVIDQSIKDARDWIARSQPKNHANGQLSEIQHALEAILGHEPRGPKQNRYWPDLLAGLCRREDGSIDHTKIDSFTTRMVEGARPSEFHNRLVHLLRPLRVRTIVDMVGGDVLPDALRKNRWPFQIIASTDPLRPPRASKEAKNLRIVEWPTSPHRAAAFEHASIIRPDATHAEVEAIWSWTHPDSNAKNTPPQCLLFLGVTDNEWWRSMLRRLLPKANGKRRIFVVTESSSVAEELKGDFSSYLSGTLNIRVASRPDLLLYELYVQVAQGLPAAGQPCSFQHPVPPHPIQPSFENRSQFEENVCNWVDIIRDPAKKTEYEILPENSKCYARAGLLRIETGGPPVGIWLHGRAGVISMTSRVFWRLSQSGSKCIWVGLNEFGGVADVERYLIRQMSAMVGAGRLAALALASSAPLETFLSLVKDHQAIRWPLRFGPGQWVVFIEARGIPGMEAGILGNQFWSADELDRLENHVVSVLGDVGVRVVYLPMSDDLRSQLVNGLKETRLKHLVTEKAAHGQPSLPMNVSKRLPPKLRCSPDSGDVGNEALPGDTAENLIGVAIRWYEKDENDDKKWHRAALLYALVLFRERAHYSALTSQAVHSKLDPHGSLFTFESEVRTPEQLEQYTEEVLVPQLDQLASLGIIRRQRGGFIHVPWLLRERLRHHFEGECDVRRPRTNRSLKGTASAVQFRISEWYAEAFRFSQDPGALVECIHHRVECLRSVPFAEAPSSDSHNQEYRNVLVLAATRQLTKALVVAKDLVRRHPDLTDGWGNNEGIESLLNGPLFGPGVNPQLHRAKEEVIALIAKLKARVSTDGSEREARKLGGAIGTVSYLVKVSVPRAELRDYGAEKEAYLQTVKNRLGRMSHANGPEPSLGQIQQWLATFPASKKLIEVAISCKSMARISLQLAKESAWIGNDQKTLRNDAMETRGYRLAESGETETLRHLDQAICYAGIAHRLGWVLPSNCLNLQLGINLRVFAIEAVALARLGKFLEAHRALNTAFGYLRFLRGASRDERGRLLLRRGEVFFLQGLSSNNEPALKVAHIQDALYWARAGSKEMQSASQHRQWLSYGLLLEAEILQRCLIEKIKISLTPSDLHSRWRHLMNLARQLAGEDRATKCRLLAIAYEMCCKIVDCEETISFAIDLAKKVGGAELGGNGCLDDEKTKAKITEFRLDPAKSAKP